MKVMKKVICGLISALAVFFCLTFTIYMFNIDSKLMASLEPVLLKWYEKIDRDGTKKRKDL